MISMEKHVLRWFLCLAFCVPGPFLGAVQRAVTSIAELKEISSQDSVQLMSDLDLSGEVWQPLCNDRSNPYEGTFEGNGHVVILPKRFQGAHTLGLFGYIGSTGKVQRVGLVSGHSGDVGSQAGVQAGSRRRVGMLAGVNSGVITQCWSMGVIANAGTVVGGLVGEQTVEGRLEDCYFTGLILNATDTIGGLVGYNEGSISRSWVAGYAKNGYAIVGADHLGTYTDCSYDRKLYYQKSGAQSAGIVAYDKSPQQYDLLPAFANHSAALLSSIGVVVDTMSHAPVNHLNDLTEDFHLSNLYGEQWRVEVPQDWIKIGGSMVEVTRPCTEMEVLVNIDLGDFVRVLYLRPRRLEDFSAGIFDATDTIRLCAGDEDKLSGYLQPTPASDGWTYGDYHYRVLLDKVDEVSGEVVQTTEVVSDAPSAEYQTWFATYALPSDANGTFVLRREAMDERCVDSWVPSKGELIFTVAAPFTPGSILSGKDTIYGLPIEVAVPNTEGATGGYGDIRYSFYQNGKLCHESADPNLTDWTIRTPGKYVFTRKAKDQFCYPNADTDSEGEYTFVVFDTIHPGQILDFNDTLVFCTPSDAQQALLEATTPTGGNGNYVYQWYLVNENTVEAIDGANEKNLSLELLPPMSYDAQYTFVRKVKDDTRFTTFKQSEGGKIVRIRPKLVAGSIGTDELSQLCWAYDEKDSKSVVINELSAAEGEELSYRWVRVSGDSEEEIASTKDLNYEIVASDVQVDTTFTYYRYVQTADCGWVRSEGAVSQTYSIGTHTEMDIQICSSDMPYQYSYGENNSHIFTYDGEVFKFSGTAENGCSADTAITCHVMIVPAISKADNGFVCQDNDQIPLYFYLNSGDASFFHIKYSPDLASYMGTTDTVGVLNEPEDGMFTIVLRDVPPLGTGDLYLQIAVGVDEQSCLSRSISMDLEIALGGYVHQKYNRVLFVDNNPDNGEIQGDKLRFCTYQWYRNGIPQEGQTGQYYQENGEVLEGTYYVYLTDTIHGVTYRSCDMVMPQDDITYSVQQIVAYPIPAGCNQEIRISGIEMMLPTDSQAETIKAVVLNSMGEVVSVHSLSRLGNTLEAPSLPGVYYLRLTDGNGLTNTIKIIVE